MRAENLTVERVSFAGTRKIIAGFNGDFRRGVNVVCGPPASGKTTLLQVLAGLRQPSRGRIYWDGKISMVSQVPEREFLHTDCAAELREAFKATGEKQIRADLESLGLSEELLSRSPWNLSRGEKRRLAILRALREYSGCDKVIIIDDPFCDLDAPGQYAVAKIIDSLRKDIIIIATNRREDLDLLQPSGLVYRLEPDNV